MESTGSWYWLADLLAALGVELVLAHATPLKAISAAKVKTDQVDSEILALLLRADFIPEAHMIRPEQRGPQAQPLLGRAARSSWTRPQAEADPS